MASFSKPSLPYDLGWEPLQCSGTTAVNEIQSSTAFLYLKQLTFPSYDGGLAVIDSTGVSSALPIGRPALVQASMKLSPSDDILSDSV